MRAPAARKRGGEGGVLRSAAGVLGVLGRRGRPRPEAPHDQLARAAAHLAQALQPGRRRVPQPRLRLQRAAGARVSGRCSQT